MWNQFLNESRSQKKFDNKPLIILGSKHSGKRTLLESMLDASKTSINNKRLLTNSESNKLRVKGLTSALDYAYINVIDFHDPDNRTHTKLEVYMVEEYEKPSIFSELARPQILKNAVFVIMLDFTMPWNFMSELDKWVKFINELQQLAALKINQLDQMAQNVVNCYKKFKEPEFDENGKLKKPLASEEKQQEQIQLDIPSDVLDKNIRLPLIVCINKCDLQTQVIRENSEAKLLAIGYHLRKFCVQYGGSLIYTSIKNNSNIDTLYQYIMHRAYAMPLKKKSEDKNQEAIFIPLGYDNMNLVRDFAGKENLEKTFEETISAPLVKKNYLSEILVEEDSEYFKKYISINSQGSASNSTQNVSESQGSSNSEHTEKKATDAKKFFQELLTGSSNAQRTSTIQNNNNQRILNAQRQLLRHTSQMINKKQQTQNPK